VCVKVFVFFLNFWMENAKKLENDHQRMMMMMMRKKTCLKYLFQACCAFAVMMYRLNLVNGYFFM